MKVSFYESIIEDEFIKFVVIAARFKDKWVFCRHKSRITWEMPGGHREIGEDVLTAAKRELWEETGATSFSIRPVCVYSVDNCGEESFGFLFYADITELSELPDDFEMAELKLCDAIPENQTYPEIIPKLFERISTEKEIIW